MLIFCCLLLESHIFLLTNIGCFLGVQFICDPGTFARRVMETLILHLAQLNTNSSSASPIQTNTSRISCDKKETQAIQYHNSTEDIASVQVSFINNLVFFHPSVMMNSPYFCNLQGEWYGCVFNGVQASSPVVQLAYHPYNWLYIYLHTTSNNYCSMAHTHNQWFATFNTI